MIYLYNQIKAHPEMDFYPRTFIFGAKASAAYARAKKIIKLTFVLMKSLNLDIEDRVRVNLNTIVLQDIFCKTLFVLELDGHELLKSLLIVCVNLKLGKLGKICDPVRSDLVCYPVSQKRVSMSTNVSFLTSCM